MLALKYFSDLREWCGLLESDLAVLDGVSCDSGPDLFRFDVIADHALTTEIRTHAIHLHEDPAVLPLSLDDPFLES